MNRSLVGPISVIVCTHNRCESLRQTLRSLGEMDFPAGAQWELLVVDNGSADHTSDVVSGFRKICDQEVRYVFEARLGLSHARNAGIRAARGEILCFIDDDVRVAPNWLSAVKKGFEEYDPICLGGRVLLQTPQERPRWWDDWCEIPCGRFDLGETVVFANGPSVSMIGIGANISFKRLAFEKCGLFTPALGRRGNQLLMGEETEFCKRLQRSGEVLMYLPTALVYHHPDARRFTKNYIRRWSYRIGQWRHLEDLGSPRSAPEILGVPRWRFRSAATSLWNTVKSYSTGRSREAFRHESQLIEFMGHIVGSFRTPFSESCQASISHAGGGVFNASSKSRPECLRTSATGRTTHPGKPRSSAATTKSITVILCTRNRCRSLTRALESLAVQQVPDWIDWEVIVVDNGSEDQTRAFVEDFSRRHHGRFRYLFEPREGKSFALNAGVGEARGEIVAFTDDDATAEPTWLWNLTAALDGSTWGGSGGRTIPRQAVSLPSWLALDGPFGMGGSLCAYFDLGGEPRELDRAPYGANMAFEKQLFWRYGGFREDLGPSPNHEIPRPNEDTEFGRRLMAAGERLRYEPSAVVYHAVSEDRVRKNYLLSWYFDFGRAAVREIGRRPDFWRIPRRFLTIPKTITTELLPRVIRWLLAANPQRRFFYKCWVWVTAGEILEIHRLWRGPQIQRVDAKQEIKRSCKVHV